VQIRTASASQRSRSNILLDQAGIRVAALCRAADDVGGDFYALAPRRAGRVAIVIGDVCGRGQAGAGLLRLVVPTINELCETGLPPAELLSEMDLRLRKQLPIDRFVTLAALEVDTRATELSVANAGHVPTLLRSGSSVRIVGRASGPPLGLARTATYSQERIALAPGDSLVLMTDGVLEALEPDLVNMTRVCKLIAEAPEGAEEMHRSLMDELEQVIGPKAADDMTLLVVDVIGGSGAWRFSDQNRTGFSCAY